MSTHTIRLTIDATGLACPMPLLKAKQGLSQLEPGEVLLLQATDPGSERDVIRFMELSEHTLVSHCRRGDVFEYILQRGEKTNP